MTTTVLITGAKSGIGKGLLALYASRPNTIVIAAIRDGRSSSAAKELENLPTGSGSKVIITSYDASSASAAVDAVADLKTNYHINALDIVIANAGILKHFGPVSKVKMDEMEEHLKINTLAPILLYQSTTELLNASSQTPKFFIISSSMGSNGLMDNYPMPMIAYGLSKAAVNFVAGKLHREEPKTVVIPVQPGWVQTAMGEKAAELNGMSASDVPVTLEQSVTGLVAVFDKATKEEHSGKFFDQNGEIVPW